jgi:hypothetical protein
MSIQRLKLTGVAILVLRASTSLQAAPAAWPSVRRLIVALVGFSGLTASTRKEGVS